MSTDEKVAKDLVQTLRDGEKGFAKTADRLRDSEHAEWAATMERLSRQRETFAREIVEMGHAYGDEVNDDGSAAGTLHRGWLSLKDALTGDDASSVLGAAESGEDHAVAEYERALESDLSDGFRALVQRQYQEVVAARDEVRSLHNAG